MKVSVLNASSYSTAQHWSRSNAPTSSLLERLVRSNALNTRHMHTGTGKHTLDDGSTEGIHVRHNQAAVA